MELKHIVMSLSLGLDSLILVLKFLQFLFKGGNNEINYFFASVTLSSFTSECRVDQYSLPHVYLTVQVYDIFETTVKALCLGPPLLSPVFNEPLSSKPKF